LIHVKFNNFQDESTKQQQYVVKDRGTFQKTVLCVVSTLACLAVVSVGLYSSRGFLVGQVAALEGTVQEKDFNEDLRTASLFVKYLNQIAGVSEMGERTDIFLDMEKAAEFDLENSLLASIAKATGKTSPAQEAIKKAVKKELWAFEKTVDDLVEETIGQQDGLKRGARTVKGDVEEKLRTTLTRISERAVGNANRQEMARREFEGMIQLFFSNFKQFDEEHGRKQKVPLQVARKLSDLIRQDADGEEQPSIRSHRLEKAMMAAMSDPAQYGVPPYEGKMKSGHHHEEYMKRVVIVSQFQRARTALSLLMERWENHTDAATVLKSLVQYTNGRMAPSLWLTLPCVRQGDWTYASWDYDIPNE